MHYWLTSRYFQAERAQEWKWYDIKETEILVNDNTSKTQ